MKVEEITSMFNKYKRLAEIAEKKINEIEAYCNVSYSGVADDYESMCTYLFELKKKDKLSIQFTFFDKPFFLKAEINPIQQKIRYILYKSDSIIDSFLEEKLQLVDVKIEHDISGNLTVNGNDSTKRFSYELVVLLSEILRKEY